MLNRAAYLDCPSSLPILRHPYPNGARCRILWRAMDLLERQEQLDELSRLLREAGKSAGKVAFVRGEAGAGKSSLVEQFATLASGTPVYWGHCDALQTSRVLGPVKELAAEAGSAL